MHIAIVAGVWCVYASGWMKSIRMNDYGNLFRKHINICETPKLLLLIHIRYRIFDSLPTLRAQHILSVYILVCVCGWRVDNWHLAEAYCFRICARLSKSKETKKCHLGRRIYDWCDFTWTLSVSVSMVIIIRQYCFVPLFLVFNSLSFGWQHRWRA